MRLDPRSHPAVRPRRRGVLAAVLGGALLVTGMTGTVAASHPAADPAVITAWNATTVRTVVTEAGINNATTFHWFAVEQAAVYNAVVGITRKYELVQVARPCRARCLARGRRRDGRVSDPVDVLPRVPGQPGRGLRHVPGQHRRRQEQGPGHRVR